MQQARSFMVSNSVICRKPLEHDVAVVVHQQDDCYQAETACPSTLAIIIIHDLSHPSATAMSAAVEGNLYRVHPHDWA